MFDVFNRNYTLFCYWFSLYMDDLRYFASFSFEIVMLGCNNGKEGICQKLISFFEAKDGEKANGGLFNRFRTETCGDQIVMSDVGHPFSNLRFTQELSIRDDSITFSYTENTDQQVMLPNIRFFVSMLLFAVKTVDIITDGFKSNHITCRIMIDNNSECFFYEKYSPLCVDYSMMLKYGLDNKACFIVEVSDLDDVAQLFNRFYQQFKTTQSQKLPYVLVNGEALKQEYAAIG